MALNLSDKIASILNAAPVSFDPEDDINEETVARVVTNTVEAESDEEVIGKFRKQNVELLEELDNRYKGKRASRKRPHDDEWSTGEESNISVQTSDSPNPDDQEDAEISSDEQSDRAIENTDNEADSLVSTDAENEPENSFAHIKDSDSSLQIQKGHCVRQQLSMWENFLEMRIQLQKMVIAGNKLPQAEELNDIKKSLGTKYSQTKKVLVDLLDKLLYLQLLLVRQYPETKSLFNSAQVQNNKTNEQAVDNDEEILSDSNEEQDNDLNTESPKKQKLNYVLELTNRHKQYQSYRDAVIQKWNDKTRIASSKVGSSTQSALKQIEYILNDKEKLIRKTQLCRIDYGLDNVAVQTNSNTNEVYSSEIFDDTDFYHQILRELIEYKSADLTDPVQLGRQWIQLQNLRSKMKRKIDTRATKGRKIRYAVHSKLVNFMAPIEDTSWQNDAKTELYNSLFGKAELTNKI